MKFFLTLLIVSLFVASAEAQNRRDRTNRAAGPDRSSTGGASGTPIPDDNTDKSSFDHYKVLTEHNIFTKNFLAEVTNVEPFANRRISSSYIAPEKICN